MRWISLPGQSEYGEVHELQKRLVLARIRDEIPDTVLTLEHKPVVTRGRGLQRSGGDVPRPAMGSMSSMPYNPQAFPHLDYAEIERGGDLTYHGPGQIVVYPILKLSACALWFRGDLGHYLRALEQLAIEPLRALGAQAEARPGSTGVWVGDQKIASIGIALKRGVTYHGLALNICDVTPGFHAIAPCGFSSQVMTEVKAVLPHALPAYTGNWRKFWEDRFEAQWSTPLKRVARQQVEQLVTG